MNSSGRLPSALCSTPVAPAPSRSPRRSTLRPTSDASSATAPAEVKNASTGLDEAYRKKPATRMDAAVAPRMTRSERLNRGRVTLPGATVCRGTRVCGGTG